MARPPPFYTRIVHHLQSLPCTIGLVLVKPYHIVPSHAYPSLRQADRPTVFLSHTQSPRYIRRYCELILRDTTTRSWFRSQYKTESTGYFFFSITVMFLHRFYPFLLIEKRWKFCFWITRVVKGTTSLLIAFSSRVYLCWSMDTSHAKRESLRDVREWFLGWVTGWR